MIVRIKMDAEGGRKLSLRTQKRLQMGESYDAMMLYDLICCLGFDEQGNRLTPEQADRAAALLNEDTLGEMVKTFDEAVEDDAVPPPTATSST